MRDERKNHMRLLTLMFNYCSSIFSSSLNVEEGSVKENLDKRVRKFVYWKI